MNNIDMNYAERALYRHPSPTGITRYNVMQALAASEQNLAEKQTELTQLEADRAKSYVSENSYRRVKPQLTAEITDFQSRVADISTSDAWFEAYQDAKEAAVRAQREDADRRSTARLERIAAERAAYDEQLGSWNWSRADLAQIEDRRVVGRTFAQSIQPIQEQIAVMRAAHAGDAQAIFAAAQKAGMDVAAWLSTFRAQFPMEATVKNPNTGKYYTLALDPDGVVWCESDVLSNAFGDEGSSTGGE